MPPHPDPTSRQSPPAFFEAIGLCGRYGGRTVVEDVTFRLNAGEILAVVGPSGAGKSTLLRLLAGLCEPSAGTLRCRGESWDRLPTWRRRIGWSGTEGWFLPHLTIRGNLDFRRRRMTAEIGNRTLIRGGPRERFAAPELVRWGGKYPHQLSAGERQRAALAGMLCFRRRLLLLDEPVAHLDVVDRPGVLRDWGAACRRKRQTVVFVTHDPTEAALIADRVLLLKGGRVEQLGTFAALSARPASPWAAAWSLFPDRNVLPAVRTEAGWSVAGRPQSFTSDVPDAATAQVAFASASIEVLAEEDFRVPPRHEVLELVGTPLPPSSLDAAPQVALSDGSRVRLLPGTSLPAGPVRLRVPARGLQWPSVGP